MKHKAFPTFANYMYWGATPFVSIALLVWISIESIAVNAVTAFIFYSSIILAFMAGTLWPLTRSAIEPSSTEEKDMAQKKATTRSIFLSLVAVLATFIAQFTMAGAVALLMLGYVILPRFEQDLAPMLPKEYLDLRAVVNRAVLVSHISVLVFVLQL
jgi:cobalamin synthase